MTSKVRVFGKAQNRTALGIVNAYLVMYPHATFEDFEKAFPKELNTDSGWPVNFKKLEECQTEDDKGFWFIEDDEVLHLQDGTNMVLVKMWTKTSYDRLVSHASQYGIEVAEFEKGMKGQKGGYRLEYLNGYVPPAPKKKGLPGWLWALLAVVLLGILAAVFFLGRGEQKDPVVVETIVHDTVYTERIEELETNFNAAKFDQGKSELNDEAKFVLHDLAELFEKQPDLKLRIIGHTSEEGAPAHNQKLSEARAKAAVDFLISQGIDESRLQYEGKGSSEPLEPGNHEANRRTEFEVIQ